VGGAAAANEDGCALCGLPHLAGSQLAQHLAGRRHAAAEARAQYTGPLACALCGVHATCEAQLAAHLAGKRHRNASLRQLAARAETALADLDTLNGWLHRLGRPGEGSKTQAREALQRVHINIHDLVEERFQPVFATVSELAAYTLDRQKVFPKWAAKQDGALRLFLRPLLKFRGAA
jgi:hypothetical protein